MHHIKETVKMLEELVYKAFTENEIEDINTFEVGRIADMIKDFTKAMYYYGLAEEHEHAEVPEKEEMSVDQIMFRLTTMLKDSDLNTMEKNSIRNKLQMLIQSL